MQPQPFSPGCFAPKAPHSLNAQRINRPELCWDESETSESEVLEVLETSDIPRDILSDLEMAIEASESEVNLLLASNALGGEADAFQESTDMFDTNDDGLDIPANLRAPERSTTSDVWGPKGPPGQSRGPLAANNRSDAADVVKGCMSTWDVAAAAANPFAYSQCCSALDLGRSIIGSKWRQGQSSRFFMRVGVAEGPFQDKVVMEEKQFIGGSLSFGQDNTSIHLSNLSI